VPDRGPRARRLEPLNGRLGGDQEGKAPLGMRVQSFGAAIDPHLSGAKKGGYAMQAAANKRPDKGKYICVRCGSDKVASEIVKVKTEEALRLLSE
jgi:hypothetical protein